MVDLLVNHIHDLARDKATYLYVAVSLEVVICFGISFCSVVCTSINCVFIIYLVRFIGLNGYLFGNSCIHTRMSFCSHLIFNFSFVDFSTLYFSRSAEFSTAVQPQNILT